MTTHLRRRRILAAIVTAATIVTLAAAPAPATPAHAAPERAAPAPASAELAAPAHAAPEPAGADDVAITLPRPSGPFLTGTTLMHLRDAGRVDPLDPAGGDRELMVQLWYPARAAAGKPLAPYAPPGETEALQANYDSPVAPLPDGAFAATTHSRLRAPVRSGVHKVVFFHHGLCASRTDTTAINEELASRGFIVVALGNTYESLGVEFPGGRVETFSDLAFCAAGGDPFSPGNQEILNRLLSVRVADTRFVLDQLVRVNRGQNPDASGLPLPRGLAHSMDTRRVGMFGHSFGGGTAAAVMHADRRFVAGVNLDGFIIGPVATAGLDRPFMLLGSSYHDPEFDPTWATFLPALTGWHRWIQLAETGHYRFIDFGGSVRKWNIDETLKPIDPENWRLVFGDIDDALSQEIVIRLTASFFAHFLHREPAPILDRPAEFYPELTDRTP